MFSQAEYPLSSQLLWNVNINTKEATISMFQNFVRIVEKKNHGNFWPCDELEHLSWSVPSKSPDNLNFIPYLSTIFE